MAYAQIILIALGFAVLALSARETIKRLAKIARRMGVSEFSISFLLVGMLTVFPELFIGINSALRSESSFGLGIVFGSNIADLTLIIGLVALFSNGIRVRNQSMKDAKTFLASTFLPVLMLADGEISRADGAILLVVFIAYVFWVVTRKKDKERLRHPTNLKEDIPIALIFVGIMMVAGNVIIDNTIALSAELAIPIFFLGVLLAVGTCLPELVFAIESSTQRHQELGLGDILGNVFADCMATTGIIALIQPIRPEAHTLTMVSGTLMILCMLIVLGIFAFKNTISKRIGVALVITYIAMVILQFIAEQAIT